MRIATYTLLFTIAFAMACKNKKTSLDTDKNIVLTDTTGSGKSNISTDTGANNAVAEKIVQNTNKVLPKNSSGSTNTDNAKNKTAPANGNSSAAKKESNSSTGNNNNTVNTKQDKGWSKAAKGTAIGAGSGAVIGAVVSKNKAKGAVIGAILGAGAGYAIGRNKDKKSGRVARKKAQRSASSRN